MTSIVLPPPCDLSLPERFSSWREGQAETVLRVVESSRRFVLLVAPTGTGKSLMGMATAKLGVGRAAYLTSSRGLSDQIAHDFGGGYGLEDIRGQANYRCRELERGGEFEELWTSETTRPTAEDGPCHGGAECPSRMRGCDYYDRFRLAQGADVVSTNYAYWIAQHRHGEGLGECALLVCDEAHEILGEVSRSLETEVSKFEAYSVAGLEWPAAGQGQEVWREWGRVGVKRLRIKVDLLAKMGSAAGERVRALRTAKRLLKKLELVAGMVGEWVVAEGGDKVRFAPVWIADYVEGELWRGIGKVVLVSATVTPKTAELLGIDRDDMDVVEVESNFPMRRRPVVYVGDSVRVKHGWTEEDKDAWVAGIDEIIAGRADRKGIVHTVSYDRARLLKERSAWAGRMITHGVGGVGRAVEEFRRRRDGAVLVSPSVGTGWDFADDAARYAVIAKVPFPDQSDPVLRRRQERDKDYGCYVAMQEVVQSAGRLVRSEADWGEALIVDGSWRWFWHLYRAFAPRWWRMAVRTEQKAPRALVV